MTHDEMKAAFSVIDETFGLMREHFAAVKDEHNTLVAGYNKTVGIAEELFLHIAEKLDEHERRLRHLETGGVVEDPPL